MSVFPDEVDTVSNSKLFTERLVMLGTTQLLQSRVLLPSQAFKKATVADTCRCWIPDKKHPIGSRLTTKLQGVGDAIHRGHLQEFIIVISTNESDSDDAKEVFTWSISYDGNIPQCSLKCGAEALISLKYTGIEDVKSQTISLLLKIRKLCREVLSQLPRDAYATLRVTYNDQTPSGYQAPGFYRSTSLYTLDSAARAMNVGGIATPHHKALLNVHSVYLDDEVIGENKLNEALASGYESSFSTNSTRDQSMEGIETPRDRPLIIVGDKVPRSSRRSAEVPKVGQIVKKLRGKKADTFSENDNRPRTPGRSFKLDKNTPSKN